MKARPILFSGPMVRALLAGSKTQTRRIVKNKGERPPTWATFGQELSQLCSDHRWRPNGLFYWSEEQADTGPLVSLRRWPYTGDAADRDWYGLRCPYGRPGDLLIVRESFARVPATAYRMSEGVEQRLNPADPYEAAIYAAGWDRSIPKWKPSIHMPRWASRLTLEITEVRVERLQDISGADAIAEGLAPAPGGWWSAFGGSAAPTPAEAYALLWNHINGPDSWAANPWVWAVSFKAHNANVDTVLGGPGQP